MGGGETLFANVQTSFVNGGTGVFYYDAGKKNGRSLCAVYVSGEYALLSPEHLLLTAYFDWYTVNECSIGKGVNCGRERRRSTISPLLYIKSESAMPLLIFRINYTIFFFF